MESAKILQQAGYPVTQEGVLALAGPGGDVCKQYIMQMLMDAGLCNGALRLALPYAV